MIAISPTQANLLRIFFINPERSFYLNEVGRMLGRKPGTFQRAINKLADEGILSSEYRANARYFQVNPSHPLYAEIKSIVAKTVGVATILHNSLKTVTGLSLAFIYGSYARGAENYLSDIDLLMVGKADEGAIVKILTPWEKRLAREINFKLYTPQDFQKRLRAGDAFLSSVIKDRKTFLIGDERELEKMIAG